MANIQLFYGFKQQGVFTDNFFIITEECALRKFEYFMLEVNEAISIRKEKITEISEEDWKTIFNLFTFLEHRDGWISYDEKYFFTYLRKK